MHDTKTVAFEIKNPFVKKDKWGYKPSIITIWHNDPQKFKFKDGSSKRGCRSDDSCGWFSPPYSEAQLKDIEKLAAQQYENIFARQVAEKQGKDYAYICNHPESTYEIVYWIWRSIKANGKKGWQYGNKKNFLSARELEYIMNLATNPVDNFKHHIIKDIESFTEMFRLVWRCYLKFQRPWHKHPCWHIKHWSFQIHPIQKFKRRYIDKCSKCGIRGFTGAAYSDWNGNEIWCEKCNNSINQQVPVKSNEEKIHNN